MANTYAKEAVRVLQEANDGVPGNDRKIELIRRGLISLGLAIQAMTRPEAE